MLIKEFIFLKSQQICVSQNNCSVFFSIFGHKNLQSKIEDQFSNLNYQEKMIQGKKKKMKETTHQQKPEAFQRSFDHILVRWINHR